MPSLPDLQQAVISPAAMQAIEQDAETRGVPTTALMANAGKAIAHLVRGRFPRTHPILVLAGSGNNGGDGSVAAHWLQHWGYQVTVLPCGPRLVHPPSIPPGPGPRVLPFTDDLAAAATPHLSATTVVIDAVLGTGASRPLSPVIRSLFDRVRQCGAPVVAVDCPSGTDLATGRADTATLPATITASLGAAKWGHRAWPAAGLLGELVVLPIGIPPESAALADGWRLGAGGLPAIPDRPANAHKGWARLTLLAGSAAMPGAAALAAMAALRAGATYLALATPPGVVRILAATLREPVWLPLSTEASEDLVAAITRGRAFALGPGLGGSERARNVTRLALAAARDAGIPTVIDADALATVAGNPALVPPGSLLTPHPGELGRMLGTTAQAIEADRFGAARDAAERFGATVILKGPHAIVATPGQPLRIAPRPEPALATAGSGDVLTGIAGALLAQGMDAHAVAQTALAWHSAAARAARHHHGHGVVASDLPPLLRQTRPAPARP